MNPIIIYLLLYNQYLIKRASVANNL